MPKIPNLPQVVLETKKLVIRPPRAGDGEEHHRAVSMSLSDLRNPTAALPWAHEDPSPDHSEKYCRWASGEFEARREFPLLLILRETNEIVGATGLHDPDWSVPSLEIGWWGRSDLHGQGFVSEGARAVLNWGFEALQARRIYAEVDEENTASCRVCERISMQFEGLMRNARVDHAGRVRNCRLYAAIR